MAQRTRIAKQMVIAALMSLVVACAPIFQKHGYVPEANDLARITVGQDTRDSVATLVGRPSTAGLLNDVGWYYVESRWVQKGLADKVETDRKVVAITFDSKGTVANIESFGLEKGRVIALSRRVTKDNVASAGFLRQLFGNVGSIGLDKALLSQ